MILIYFEILYYNYSNKIVVNSFLTIISNPYFIAICKQPCENGGWCVSPNQCQCPVGFTGNSCGEDINECLLSVSVHKCGTASRCVNKPGWYENMF